MGSSVSRIQQDGVDSLFALGPALTCNPASKKVQAYTRDATSGQLFSACAEQIPDRPGYTRLKVSNRYAFPILLWPHGGVGVGFDDMPTDVSLLDFVRHVLWMQFNKEEAVGADTAQMIVSPQAQLPLQFNGYLDWGAVAVDTLFVLVTDVLAR